MVCGNFIRLEPASYVFFCTFFNLRNLLYLIFYPPVYLIFTFQEFKSIHKGKTAILHLCFGTEKNRRLGSKKARYIRAFRRRHLFCLHIMVCPTGFEPAAFGVGVIRPSIRKALRRKGLVEIAQISAILKKSHRILAGQGFRDFSR